MRPTQHCAEDFLDELAALKELRAIEKGRQIEYYDDRTHTWKHAFFFSMTALDGLFIQRIALMEPPVDSVYLRGPVCELREKIRLQQDTVRFLF